MNKIKEFFRRGKYTPFMYGLAGMLLLMAILSAVFGQWLQAVCCLLWLFVQYQSARVNEQNARALEVMDIQEQMIKAMTEELELGYWNIYEKVTELFLQEFTIPVYA